MSSKLRKTIKTVVNGSDYNRFHYIVHECKNKMYEFISRKDLNG